MVMKTMMEILQQNKAKLGLENADAKELAGVSLIMQNQFIILDTIMRLSAEYGFDHFYMIWHHDFRGRLYPKMTEMSHIGYKMLRPMFLLKDTKVDMILLESIMTKPIGAYKDYKDLI